MNVHGQIAIDAPDSARNLANLWLHDKADRSSYLQFTNSGTTFTDGLNNVNMNDGFIVGQYADGSLITTQEPGEQLEIVGASNWYEDHGYTISKALTTDATYQRGYIASVSSPTNIATAKWRKNLQSVAITSVPNGGGQ